MIRVNGRKMEWRPGITFSEIYRELGYTITSPRVNIRVNGKPVPKNERDRFIIADGSEIEIINTLCGG